MHKFGVCNKMYLLACASARPFVMHIYTHTLPVEESAQSPSSNDNQAFLSAAYAPGTVHSAPTTPAGYSKDALLDPFEASFIRHQSHQSGTAKPTSKPISARSLLARSPSADIAADSQLRASGGVGSRALSDEECFSYPTATGNISNHARRGSEQTPRRTPHDSDSQLQGDHCVLKDDTLTAAIGGMSLLGESPASRNLSRSSSANKMGMESNTLPAQLKGRTRSKARIVLS